ncbi:MAG TPA: chorismate mutase [Brevundimonas sp.]|uniref:chorismate mutase n=1 Tax=Brevundimonas sp. TaxID=1871086 RepID=UPI002DE57A11|nr:chorismate mutase [Brevundimonas sp.]
MTLSLASLRPASADDMTLGALRHEIDLLDDQMLALFQRRLALADRVGRAKDAPSGTHLPLRPDREAAVLARMTGRARPDQAAAVAGLWREIVGWGLARQTETQIRVWAPAGSGRAVDAARRRFGQAATLVESPDAEAALAFAAEGRGVAVLALNAERPWWLGLRSEWSDLRVFDGCGRAAPRALAVGRVDPAALAPGRRVSVSSGGADFGPGAGRWGLATHRGWTLSLVDASVPADRVDGLVGTVP